MFPSVLKHRSYASRQRTTPQGPRDDQSRRAACRNCARPGTSTLRRRSVGPPPFPPRPASSDVPVRRTSSVERWIACSPRASSTRRSVRLHQAPRLLDESVRSYRSLGLLDEASGHIDLWVCSTKLPVVSGSAVARRSVRSYRALRLREEASGRIGLGGGATERRRRVDVPGRAQFRHAARRPWSSRGPCGVVRCREA